MAHALLKTGIRLSKPCKNEIRQLLSKEGARSNQFINSLANVIEFFKTLKQESKIPDESDISRRQLERVGNLSGELARILGNLDPHVLHRLRVNYAMASSELAREDIGLDININIPRTDQEIEAFTQKSVRYLLEHLKLHSTILQKDKELESRFAFLRQEPRKGAPSGFSDELTFLLRFGIVTFSRTISHYKVSSSENSIFHKIMLIIAEDVGIKNKYGKPYQSLKEPIKKMMEDRPTKDLLRGRK